MKTRTDLLNFLAEKYNLRRYLEIGLQRAEQNFNKVICEYKLSVDPDPEAYATFCRTSDEFFESHPNQFDPFDIVFLDGEHSEHQLEKDFYNALKVTRMNGWIVMHDTNPESEELTHFPRDKKGSWNGSAYKFAARLKSKNYFTVNIDHGLSVYQKTEAPLIKSNSVISWEYFDKNRKGLLNLISWQDFINL